MQTLDVLITDKATGTPVDRFVTDNPDGADDRIKAACEANPHSDLHVRIDTDVNLATVKDW